jgi:hypothetical protein
MDAEMRDGTTIYTRRASGSARGKRLVREGLKKDSARLSEVSKEIPVERETAREPR